MEVLIPNELPWFWY